jgi:hypothetical protein
MIFAGQDCKIARLPSAVAISAPAGHEVPRFPGIFPQPAKTGRKKQRKGSKRSSPSTPAFRSDVDGPTDAQILNGRVERSEWHDPTDDRPNAQRDAKVVAGYRSVDNLQFMHTCGSLSKTQARSGQRLRKAWELSLGASASATARMGNIPSHDVTAYGPTEARFINVDRFNAAKAAVGRLWDVIEPIVCGGLSVREYSRRYKLNPAAVSARLIAGLDVLTSYYETLDAPARVAARG